MEEALIVTCVLVVTANVAVITMVIVIRELRTFTNYFVVSLAVSDMLTGVVHIPLLLSEYAKATGFIVFFIMSSGVLNLCAVTWDRYTAVIDPFGYKNKLQKYYKKILIAVWMTSLLFTLIPLAWNADLQSVYHKYFLVVALVVFVIVPYVSIVIAKVIDPFGYKNKLQKYYRKILIVVWMTSFLFTLIPLAWYVDGKSVYHKYFLVVALVVFVIVPYVSIVIAYVRIWLRLRSHAAMIKKIMDITNEQREGARRASLEGKTVKVFIVVASVFLVSWLPVLYMTVVESVLGRPDLVPIQLQQTSLFSVAGSSLLNPLLYALMKRDFKAKLVGWVQVGQGH
ncbi:hypothetical protein QZH41_007899 [Actinostola sp. cb2023]|nr:hypothetical protein QZH41_007899 [Actinostola sp. cb2023]